MIGSLLVPVECCEGESVRGFLLRLSEANMLPRSIWIKDDPAAMAPLRTLIGQKLYGRIPAWLREKEGLEVSPICIDKSHILGNLARGCPHCLAESPYWRFEWEHALYTVCHRHGCLLVGQCPECSSYLTWDRPQFGRCNCGSSIVGWESIKVPDLERHLCARLAQCLAADTGRLPGIEENRFSVLPEKISTAELATLLLTFGTYGEISASSRKPGGYQVAKISAAYDFVRVTARMLEDWPSRFYSYMRETGLYGLPSAVTHEPPPHFLAFVRVLRTRFNTPALEFALTEYQKFMTENWQGVMNNRHSWSKGKNFEQQRYMSAASAARALRVTPKRVRELVDQNILRGYVKNTLRNRDFVVVERSSLAGAEDVFSDHIPLTGAAILLGLPQGRVHELINGGFLTPIIDETGRKRMRLFSRKEIAAFVKRLSTNHREADDEENLITASTILKTHLATEEEFAALIAAILSSAITTVVVTSQKKGFAGLSFGRDEFYRWRSAIRENVTDIQLTVVQAAARLGVKQEVAYHLVRTGLLSSTIAILGKKRCRLVRLIDLEQFQGTYISAIALAKVNRTSSTAVVQTLRSREVLPVAGPSIDHCRQYFFKRVSLPSTQSLEGLLASQRE